MMKSNFQSFQALQFWERNVQYFIVENIRSLNEETMDVFQKLGPSCAKPKKKTKETKPDCSARACQTNALHLGT